MSAHARTSLAAHVRKVSRSNDREISQLVLRPWWSVALTISHPMKHELAWSSAIGSGTHADGAHFPRQ